MNTHQNLIPVQFQDVNQNGQNQNGQNQQQQGQAQERAPPPQPAKEKSRRRRRDMNTEKLRQYRSAALSNTQTQNVQSHATDEELLRDEAEESILLSQ